MNTTSYADTRNLILHGLNAPLAKGERRVPQYGPEWVAHVTAGGRVRNGNILVP